MLMISAALEDYDCFIVTHPCARTKALAAERHVYLLSDIGTSLWRMALAFFQALWILSKERPQIVISTGASVAIPFSWMGKLLGVKVVYIESWSRIKTRSGTGPLVYPAADLFLVQWPSLLEEYGPKARYWGGVV
jgi:UDP-N-acetylglucosamine:LPS N-acetylglucosamine transferase